jgi:hydrogenase-4 component F
LATLFFVLGIPLLGSVVLALSGHRDAGARSMSPSAWGPSSPPARSPPRSSRRPALRLESRVLHRSAERLPGHPDRFVGLTTAIFSRPYMRVERDHGKMTPNRMRLYHSMYQLFSFTMLMALTTNNWGSCGWRWKRRR